MTPGPTYVTVQMVIPSSTKIPSDAQAFIMAPNIINDRFVQLNPPYTGGPTMPNHGLIPESRTAVPVSVDEVIDSLNQFALALGPSGANQHGALSNLLHSAAVAFGPNGSALHSTLLDLGQLFGSLSSQGPDLTDLFDNLGNLSKVASQYTGTYESFAKDLAVVSTTLSSDGSDLGSALTNLQQFLGQLASFIHTNASAFGSSVHNLNAFAGAVAQRAGPDGAGVGDPARGAAERQQRHRPGDGRAAGARRRGEQFGRRWCSRCAATRSSTCCPSSLLRSKTRRTPPSISGAGSRDCSRRFLSRPARRPDPTCR